jgi:hypothetical protein
MRSNGTAAVSVYAIRKDGFSGPIKIGLQDPPSGFSAYRVTLSGDQAVTRLALKTDLVETKEPVRLVVEGRANARGREIAHAAVPAEDRMQAFLWRHLVPAEELKALVFDPSHEPPAKRVRRTPAPPPVEATSAPAIASASPTGAKPKFSKQQVAGRLRQLKLLFEEWLLTEEGRGMRSRALSSAAVPASPPRQPKPARHNGRSWRSGPAVRKNPKLPRKAADLIPGSTAPTGGTSIIHFGHVLCRVCLGRIGQLWSGHWRLYWRPPHRSGPKRSRRWRNVLGASF